MKLFYGEKLQILLKNEKNPVNRMYLNEVMIKWRRLQSTADSFMKDPELLPDLVKHLDEFSTNVRNPKYKYSVQNKTGFKAISEIYSTAYLDDLISLLMTRHDIFKQKGIVWGYTPFTMGMKFQQASLVLGNRNPSFDTRESPKFLQLVQSMDFQFRLTGKRNFSKYSIKLPILTFFTFRNLQEEQFIHVEYFAKSARTTFERGRTIIVTESLDPGFIPDIPNSFTDAIFLLRKPNGGKDLPEMNLDVVKKLDKKIEHYLYERESSPKQVLKKGYFES